MLVSAFVVRWRLEMHAFHLLFGECTITLQDVAFQLGLHIEGDPVSGCMSSWEHFEGNDIFSLCEELLGVVPWYFIWSDSKTLYSTDLQML